MCRGERIAEWHTKRLVDAEQQQAMAILSSLPSWVRCTLEDIRAHQLDLAQQWVGVHVADDSLDGLIIDWAVEGGYFSCDRFGSRAVCTGCGR